jgi:hypothetical protein
MTSFSFDDSFITQGESNGVRHYQVQSPKHGARKYPSVSTLVGSFQNKDGLRYWAESLGRNLITEEEKSAYSTETISELIRERGNAAANEVKNTAAKRGTKVHQLCEDYFQYNRVSDDPCFRRLLPFLQICEPIAVETKVKWEWETNDTVVGWAGRFDNVSLVDVSKLVTDTQQPLGLEPVPAIIDYKTWNKVKYNKGQTKDGSTYYPLLSYYLQLTAYLAAFNQCRYYPTLVKDCFLVGVTETCKEAWLYHLSLHKINLLFIELKKMVLAHNKLGSYSWEELEEQAEQMLGERVYLTAPKLPF